MIRSIFVKRVLLGFPPPFLSSPGKFQYFRFRVVENRLRIILRYNNVLTICMMWLNSGSEIDVKHHFSILIPLSEQNVSQYYITTVVVYCVRGYKRTNRTNYK